MVTCHKLINSILTGDCKHSVSSSEVIKSPHWIATLSSTVLFGWLNSIWKKKKLNNYYYKVLTVNIDISIARALYRERNLLKDLCIY